jgi:hypothetical protein
VSDSVNRTLRNALIGTVAGGALIALPAVALGRFG